ncbi:MAG: HEAT repeat domain-containing protein, partial [Blastocatellia bacterium]
GKYETRNLGVFLLHETDGAVQRVEIYNLDRAREYSGYPVYWLGRGANEESLALLESFITGNQDSAVAARRTEHAVMALALHDDPRVAGRLKTIAQQTTMADKARSTAVFWLGQVGGETPFLSDLVRNEGEKTELRKQAAFAIGVGKDKAALTTLRTLYAGVTPRELKRQIIFAASINEAMDDAVTFLIDVSQKDSDQELRKQAIFWLGQKAGQRSLQVLGDTIDSNDASTEVQKQAVFALSRRPHDEAIPALIRVARTHQKAEVRKQAMFWLGQSGDPRAIDLFREILTR